ncbi:Hsp70 family protein [Thiofilum flexile]|uniref:Hsp70 family protein n=1 Tax=Thiofilum flexile TaxID=125627 RepID=UPI000364BB63|nr:Hsp70 family protein [Thiofilum flexile]
MGIIGIDLGTTNSACAVWRNGQVEMIPNRLGEYLTPSVVHIDSKGMILVGKVAQERLLTHANQTAAVFKRYMGTDRLLIGGKQYTAPELSACVLRSLKEDAEIYLGEPITEAVISVPAYFNNNQRKATLLAAQLAHLRVERLINEPTAAAIAYGLHEKPESTQFMVLDLGGGTFDVSIMEYFEGVLEVHASAGDNFLGGEDFLEILLGLYLQQAKLTKNQLDSHSLQTLYAHLEQAKRQFNSAELVHIEPFLAQVSERISIKREDYITHCETLLQRIRFPIETALRDAKLKPSELDDVILVGGATRMQFFRTMVAKLFRRMPSANLDPDLVVAMGASIQAGLKARDAALDDIVLTDVCPYSLGTGVVNNNDYDGQQGFLFSPIIERNTVVPASRVQLYTTSKDNQTEVEIDIYQGESRLVKNNIKLGAVTVKVPRKRKGEESIAVRFSYDTNGVLEVDIKVLSTGQEYHALIQNTPGQLSDTELKASQERLGHLKFHPREDEANKVLLARAERLYEGRLEYERQLIAQALQQFEAVLEHQDPQAALEAREQFDEFLSQFEQDRLF